jgi:apolipoprotein N-acyltransferase
MPQLLGWVNKFVNKKNWTFRLTELFILIIHLILLKWILHVLGNGGTMPAEVIVAHFAGIGLFGALIIRFCAWLYQRQYQKAKIQTPSSATFSPPPLDHT